MNYVESLQQQPPPHNFTKTQKEDKSEANPYKLAQMTSFRLHDFCTFYVFYFAYKNSITPSIKTIHMRRMEENILKLFIIFILYTKIAYRHYQQMFLLLLYHGFSFCYSTIFQLFNAPLICCCRVLRKCVLRCVMLELKCCFVIYKHL